MTSYIHRNVAVVLTFLVLAFMLAGFYLKPDLTHDQRVTMMFCRAVLGGLVSAYLGGRVALRYGVPRAGTLAVSATGGFAVFLLLLYRQPYFDHQLVERCREAAPKIGGLVGACEGTCNIIDSSAQVSVTIDDQPYDRERWISRCVEHGGV